jgi:Tol biopolymer transport system component
MVSIILVGWMLSFPVSAQFYNGSQMTFGKNRVQYTDFLWTYFRFNNFDVYYYLNGKELAQHTADYVGKYIPEIEAKLQSTLDRKTQFIVYNTYADLKQSNIGLMNQEKYNTGGITHIIGTKVFLYFDGDLNHFDRQIRAGINRLLIENMIYGGSLGSQVKNSTLINLPSWFIDGLVSYHSRNWDTELDNKVKDGILSEKYKRFNHLIDDDAVIAGHSLWRFVAEKYGEENIANIVYMTRVNRSFESGFLYVLGVSFKKVVEEWYDWYNEIYSAEANAYSPYNTKLKLKMKRDMVYNNLRISPDGEKILYSFNDKGRYKVFIHDLATGKKKRIFKKGFRTDEKVDYSYPLLAWHPTGNVIAMMLEHKGLLYLYFYDVETREWRNQNIFNFQKILDFAYSPDGRSFVMSAVQRGQSDIYVYNVAANTTEPVTQDVYNDLNPRFLAKSNRIIFSSNRPDDTIRFTKENLRSYDGLENNDLFIYERGSGSKVLNRVTKTRLANEIQPMSYSPGYFTYLSDANGVYNRYAARFDSAVAYVDTTVHYRYFTQTFPLTNYPRSILSQEISYAGRKTSELVFEDNKYSIYTGEIPVGKISPLQNLETSKYMLSLEAKEEKAKESAILKKLKPEPKVKRKRFVAVYENDISPLKPDTSGVDINNYQISGDITGGKSSLFQSKVLLPESTGGIIKLPKPRNYNVEYSVNQLISQLDFSYLNLSYQPYLGYAGPVYQNSPANALFVVGATDLLEDYRLIGGIRLNTSLVNNEYLFGYANLKHRLDREVYFHRTGFDVSYSDAYVRTRTHELHYVLRYPFTEVLAIKGTATVQYNKPYVMAYDYPTANMTADGSTWAIGKGELVYDNTREIGTNLLVGLRYKVFGEYYQLVKKPSVNMIVFGFDIRNYTRIHRSFIWANRISGSTSFGKNKLLYYMGGVDNWLAPKFNYEYQIDYTQNYAFQTLATNMRGFAQNARSGNTFALFSSELRFPVFRYFLNKPLRSEFLNNFQIVGFTDIGSAWQGLNPLTEENTYYTRYISSPPLDITVQVQKDPLIAGYGFGLRSTLFGYFLRADWAWGVEDQVIQPYIFYLSLSLDF